MSLAYYSPFGDRVDITDSYESKMPITSKETSSSEHLVIPILFSPTPPLPERRGIKRNLRGLEKVSSVQLLPSLKIIEILQEDHLSKSPLLQEVSNFHRFTQYYPSMQCTEKNFAVFLRMKKKFLDGTG